MPKFTPDRPFADPERAVRKLMEIANATEAMHDDPHLHRAHQRAIPEGGGSLAEYVAGIVAPSPTTGYGATRAGTYVKFTHAGADLFT